MRWCHCIIISALCRNSIAMPIVADYSGDGNGESISRDQQSLVDWTMIFPSSTIDIRRIEDVARIERRGKRELSTTTSEDLGTKPSRKPRPLLRTGEIVGIAIGGVVAIVLIIALVLVCRKHKAQREKFVAAITKLRQKKGKKKGKGKEAKGDVDMKMSTISGLTNISGLTTLGTEAAPAEEPEEAEEAEEAEEKKTGKKKKKGTQVMKTKKKAASKKSVAKKSIAKKSVAKKSAAKKGAKTKK